MLKLINVAYFGRKPPKCNLSLTITDHFLHCFTSVSLTEVQICAGDAVKVPDMSPHCAGGEKYESKLLYFVISFVPVVTVYFQVCCRWEVLQANAVASSKVKDTDKLRHFASSESNNCFIIPLLSFFLVDMSQSDGNTRKQPQFTDSYQITWWAVGQWKERVMEWQNRSVPLCRRTRMPDRQIVLTETSVDGITVA